LFPSIGTSRGCSEERDNCGIGSLFTSIGILRGCWEGRDKFDENREDILERGKFKERLERGKVNERLERGKFKERLERGKVKERLESSRGRFCYGGLRPLALALVSRNLCWGRICG
jgi:hypothetical protein